MKRWQAALLSFILVLFLGGAFYFSLYRLAAR